MILVITTKHLLFFINNLFADSEVVTSIVICCIVTRTTWLLVSWEYKKAMFLRETKVEAGAEREAERQLRKDVGQK